MGDLNMNGGAHTHGGEIVGIVKWIVTGLLGVAATLLGVIYHRIDRSMSALFRWKDTRVEPFIESVTRDYVREGRCDKRHEELKEWYQAILKEQQHSRDLLEHHLGLRGREEGPRE